MTAQDAARLTTDNVTRIMHEREENSTFNLRVLLDTLIIRAALKGYGSIVMSRNKLLRNDEARLTKLGYTVRGKGAVHLSIVWEPQAKKQNYAADAADLFKVLPI